MAEILPSIAYVRHQHGDTSVLRALGNSGRLGSPDAMRRIWELLETPQTIETLCRVLTRECGVATDACHRDLHALLGEMQRKDLIQVSPDS